MKSTKSFSKNEFVGVLKHLEVLMFLPITVFNYFCGNKLWQKVNSEQVVPASENRFLQSEIIGRGLNKIAPKAANFQFFPFFLKSAQLSRIFSKKALSGWCEI
jgi:hypothetical protein